MLRKSLILFAIGAGLGLGATLSFYRAADAQVLRGHNTSAPVDFFADRIEVQDRADRVVVTGNVQVSQAGLSMTAQRLTVAYHDSNGVEIDRLDASGGVTVTRGDERASGSVAIYDLNRKLITLIGNVQLIQGSNRLAGSRLVIDLTSGRSTVDGSAARGTTTGANGRVSGTFKVRQRGTP
jgi:lipopolysaccharide export system protein LptA